MPLQLGTTILSQIKGLASSEDQQSKILLAAGLNKLLVEKLMNGGERSDLAQHALISKVVQEKLARHGISVDETWVVMAKTAADPNKDCCPPSQHAAKS